MGLISINLLDTTEVRVHEEGAVMNPKAHFLLYSANFAIPGTKKLLGIVKVWAVGNGRTWKTAEEEDC